MFTKTGQFLFSYAWSEKRLSEKILNKHFRRLKKLKISELLLPEAATRNVL